MTSAWKTARSEAKEALRYSQPPWWQVGVVYFLLIGCVRITYMAADKLLGIGKTFMEMQTFGEKWRIQFLLPVLVYAITILLFLCLFIGLKGYCLGTFRGVGAGIWNLFSGLWRIGPIFVLNILMSLFCTLWTIIPLVIGKLSDLCVLIFAGPEALQKISVMVQIPVSGGIFRIQVSAIWAAAVLVAVIIFVYKCLQYKMAPYVLLDDPYETARQAIKKSKALMRGKIGSLLLLLLSFLGHLLLLGLIAIASGILAGSLYFALLTTTSVAEVPGAVLMVLKAMITNGTLVDIFVFINAPMQGLNAWIAGATTFEQIPSAIFCVLVRQLLMLPFWLRMIFHYTCAEAGFYEGSQEKKESKAGFTTFEGFTGTIGF